MGSDEFRLTLSLISIRRILTLSRSRRGRMILAGVVLCAGATMFLQLVVVVIAALFDDELVEGVVEAEQRHTRSSQQAGKRGEARRTEQDW